MNRNTIATRPLLLGDTTTELADTVTRLGVAPGDLVAGYQIVRLIGRGGMGCVFQAVDSKLGRAVALKTLLADTAARPASREQFLREAQALASISNDHVVTVHDVGDHAGLPYLVMELLRGDSLGVWMARGPLPLLHILKVGREIATGLAAAHQGGVIHRDLKPDNVVLDPRNDRAILIDFGLALTPATSAEGVTGTPFYMAPEQLRGEPLDARADLFALGVILFRLCTGELPFGGETLAGWRSRLLADDAAVPVARLNPLIPRPLSDLVARLLAKAIDDRPDSAATVEWELCQILLGFYSFTSSGTLQNAPRLPADGPRMALALANPTPVPDGTLSHVRTGEPASAPVAPPHPRWRGWAAATALALGLVAVLLANRTSAPSGVVFLPTAAPGETPARQPVEPIRLFDGRTLAGWHGADGKTDRWEVRNGVLFGTPKGGQDQFLISDREFTDYELSFEFRWPKKGGHTYLTLRAKDGGPQTDKDKAAGKDRVTGLQLNLGDDEHFEEIHGRKLNALYASGGFHVLNGPRVPAPNQPLGEWNRVRVVSDRSRLLIEWNGTVTFDEDLNAFAHVAGSVPGLARTRGSIAFRTHLITPIELREIGVTPISR